ncbi:MAG: hypothetical protein A2427_02365 [Candidatus Nealsonbacteria bacterium RIFOXYC1_FULL_40_7]|uniref:TIR domain-containing protein n=1 Tax=Candidatus Nealsonbacteria bacterium RIFOXYC1_FULL_40_7 TaxID=1801678 RepID=A0A1G2ERX7_9BACT|nr:MAG: hypothetical protein A2427_02365 [Candidatus Nealsonbacteria bacterium RIFOXYC1_FULL_40_7]
MDNKDITTLIEILKHKRREDLSSLLKESLSEVEQSTQYGSRWNSVISSFLIFAPLDNYYKLKDLEEKDKKIILDSILEIYPIADGLPEITLMEFRILREEYRNKELATYVGRTVRVFVSYSTEDKKFAGELKQQLEELGLEVFIAHEDINPSSDWQETILNNLKSTDIFMPVMTKNFHVSFWTDQESGIAFGEEKFIMPIAVDGVVPYGFLGKFQAYRQNSENPINVCEIIEAVIKGSPDFSSPLLDSLIKSFANSHTYDSAGSRSTLLLKFTEMTAEQVNEIFRSVLQNGQIYEYRSANKNIKELFKKYKQLLDEKLLERVLDKEELSLKDV